MKRLIVWINMILRKQKRMKRWQRIITVLASVIIFATTYALILPAITVEKNNTNEVAGMYLEYAAVPDAAEETLEEDSPVPGEIQSETASESSIAGQEDELDSGIVSANSDEVEENAPAAPVVLTTSGQDYTVNITCDETSGVPSDAELLVSEILQGTEEYEKYLLESGKAIGLSEEDVYTKCAARFFDIKIMVGGEEFKPENGVTVEITYDEPMAENLDKEISALHFKDNADSAEIVEATTAEVREDGTVAVEFQAESFSVYGVVGTGAITTTYLTSKGETYFIKVDIEGVTNIPAGSKLVVREIEEDSDEYEKLFGDTWLKLNEDYLAAIERNVNGEGTGAEDEQKYARNILQAVFFDISFNYKGKEIEPNAPVQVEIQLTDGLNNMEEAESTVIHFAKDQVELIADVETKESEDKVSGFQFSQESFSVDGLLTVVEADRIVREPASLDITTKSSTLVPPEAHKWSTDNGDGTYKIHLNVTGDAQTEEDVKKSNVIIIMDRSSSMRYGLFTEVGTSTNGVPDFTLDPQVTYYRASRNYEGGLDGNALYQRNNGTLSTSSNSNTPYTGTVYTFRNRLSYEQEALGLLVHDLLSYNEPAGTVASDGTTRLDDIVEMAVVWFNSSAGCNTGWTNNESTIINEINRTATSNETHWWDALNQARSLASSIHSTQPDEDVHVIFLTDGRPLEIVLNIFNPTPEQYENKCVPAVRNLMNLGDYIHLYNIYTYGSLIDQDNGADNPGEGRYPEKQRLQDLTAVAQTIGDAEYHDADDVQALLDIFSGIFSNISSSIAYGRVVLTDTLTHGAASSALVNGRADGFTYTVTDKSTGAEVYSVTAADVNGTTNVTFYINGTPHTNDVEEKTGTDGKTYYEVTVDGKTYKMALASFNESTHKVDWDLGGIGTLDPSYVYELSFDMWPNQDAYDYLADLNNGKPNATWNIQNEYPVYAEDGETILYYKGGASEYTDDVVRYEDGDGNSTYRILTNSGQELTYSIVTNTNGNISYEGPFTKPLETPEPMKLVDRKVQVQKTWSDSLDDDELEEAIDEYEGEGGFQAKLILNKGNTTYIDGINIKPVYKTVDGELVHDKETDGVPNELQRVWPEIEDGDIKAHDISAGLMISEDMARSSGLYSVLSSYPDKYPQVTGNGTTYFLLDSGYDYSFAEDDIDPHFELEENVYHPMVVDNELKNVILTMDGNTGTAEISDLDTDEDDNPVVKANNVLKGGINILKKVFDPTGEEVTEVLVSDDTFKVKVTLVQKDGTPYENWDYRIYYGQNNPNGEWSEQNQNYGRTGHITGGAGNGGIIEEELYVGDVIRIINVPAGVSYSVEETDYDDTLYSLGADFTFSYTTGGGERDFTTDSNGVSYMISVGTSDNFVVDEEHKVKGNSASQAVVVNKVPTAEIKLLKLGDAQTPLDDVTFKLYYDEECTRIVTKDALGNDIPSIDSNGVIHTDEDGYASLGTLAGTYYLKEIKTKDVYIQFDEPIKISIVKNPANEGKEKVTAECDQENILFPNDPNWIMKGEDGIWVIKINNPSGIELPHTGGPGTLLYTLSGFALILASALMYGFRMRRRERRLNESL